MTIYQFTNTHNNCVVHEKYFLNYSDALAYKQDYELADVDIFTHEDGTVEEMILGEYTINTIVVKESYRSSDFFLIWFTNYSLAKPTSKFLVDNIKLACIILERCS